MTIFVSESHGSWLAGTNCIWHGGIYLTEVTAPGSLLKPDAAEKVVPLQCIAEGEVVAWRLNNDYIKSTCLGQPVQYFSTFLLVKSTCKPDPEKESSWLEFYSLYMGLAPLCTFKKCKCMKAKPLLPKKEQQMSDFYKGMIDKLDSDNNGELSGQELYEAVHNPALGIRDIAGRLLVKHESEWFGGSGHPKWMKFFETFDPLRKDFAKKWLNDMEWMSQVEPFVSGGAVWHMHPVIFLSILSGNSGLLITYEQLKAMLPADRESEAQTYLEPLNEAMKLFEINTPLRKSHFMAQILHKTGFFNIVRK